MERILTSRFRSLCPDRARKDVGDFAPVLHLAPNLAQRGLDLVCRYAGEFQVFDRRRDQRLDFNRVPRADAEDRRGLRIKVTPRDCMWRRREAVCGVCRPRLRQVNENSQQRTDQT
jgi:hypothetical protein